MVTEKKNLWIYKIYTLRFWQLLNFIMDLAKTFLDNSNQSMVNKLPYIILFVEKCLFYWQWLSWINFLDWSFTQGKQIDFSVTHFDWSLKIWLRDSEDQQSTDRHSDEQGFHKAGVVDECVDVVGAQHHQRSQALRRSLTRCKRQKLWI